MNNIQKLINELIAERAKANETTYQTMYTKGGGFDYFLGKESAFALCIQKLTLLLSDKHTEAITEEAHSANTMLGEVCPCCKRPTSEPYRASSSETGDVRQNLDKLKPEE